MYINRMRGNSVFLVFVKISFLRRPSPKCPVDRQPLSRDKVRITHVLLVMGHANSCCFNGQFEKKNSVY